ncbi:MAG: AAA family ATPase [Acidimicrobiales bacterium]
MSGARDVSSMSVATGAFFRDGDCWTVGFEGAIVRLADSRGLELLSSLLAAPGRDIHALDLTSTGASMLRGEGDAGPILDGAAKAAYRRRLLDLRAEVDEAEAFADLERAARAQAEVDALVEQLSAAVGLGGRDRLAASGSERARVRATRAIRSALGRVAAALPALGAHLEGTIHTGTYCAYRPDPRVPVRWQTEAPPRNVGDVGLVFPPRLRAEADLPPPFVGRAQESQLLLDRWRASKLEGAQLVLVSGEPGIGKTRLAAEVSLVAKREGAQVLYGRCDRELAFGYDPFAQALGPLVDWLPRDVVRPHVVPLARLGPSFEQRLQRWWPLASGRGDVDRYQVFVAVEAVLAGATAAGPVVLVLDDLHCADRPGLQLLRYLARAEDVGALTIIAVYRDTDTRRGDPLVGALAGLRREPGITRCRLAGLGRIEVEALLLAHGADTAGADEVHAATAGNPLFVKEISYGGGTALHRLPAGIRESVEERVGRLPGLAGQVLAVASVAGAEFDLVVLQRAASVDEEELLQAVENANAAGLITPLPDAVDRYGWVHGVMQAGVYEGIEAARRIRLHARVGGALQKLFPHDHRAIAHHLLLAAPVVDTAQTVDECYATATEAFDRGAFEETSRWGRAALAVLDSSSSLDDRRRAEILVTVGGAEIRSGRPEVGKVAVREATDVAAECGATDLIVRAALAFGSLSVATTPEEVDEPVRFIRQALAAIGSDDDRARVALLCALARWRAFVSTRDERRALERDALGVARGTGAPALIADALVAALYTRSGPLDVAAQVTLSTELYDLAVGLRDPETQALALLYRAFALLHLGDHAAAGDAEDRFAALARELHRPFFDIYRIAIAGRRACVTGDYSEALRLAASMEDAARRAGWDVTVPTDLQRDLLWACWFVQGRFHELAMLPPPRGDGRWSSLRSAWEAATAVGVHRWDDARQALSRSDEAGFAALADDGLWSTAVPMLALACSVLSDDERAERLYESVVPFAALDCTAELAAFNGATSHHLGMLAATFGATEVAVGHLEETLEHHELIGAVSWATQTRFELAAALRQRGRRGDVARARALSDAAQTAATVLGIVPRSQLTESQ